MSNRHILPQVAPRDLDGVVCCGVAVLRCCGVAQTCRPCDLAGVPWRRRMSSRRPRRSTVCVHEQDSRAFSVQKLGYISCCSSSGFLYELKPQDSQHYISTHRSLVEPAFPPGPTVCISVNYYPKNNVAAALLCRIDRAI